MVTARQAIVAAIAAVLARWKIYDGADARRTALAEGIVDTGEKFGEDQLRSLFELAERTPRVRSPIGLVISWLERGSWVEQLKGPADESWKARTYQPPEEWAEQVEIHRLLSIALGDRKPATVVASVFGMSVERVRDIVNTHGRRSWGDRAVDLWLGVAPRPSFPRKSKENHDR